jgi:hypothetical protein
MHRDVSTLNVQMYLPILNSQGDLDFCQPYWQSSLRYELYPFNYTYTRPIYEKIFFFMVVSSCIYKSVHQSQPLYSKNQNI